MGRAFRNGALLAGLGVVAGLVSMRCADVDRGLGQACIRDSDCLSGVCAGQECVAVATLFDAAATFDAGVDAPAADAASDASHADTGNPMNDAGKSDAIADAAHEATDAADAASDVKGDAPLTDGGLEASPHDGATHDGSADVAVDGHLADGKSDAPPKDGAAE